MPKIHEKIKGFHQNAKHIMNVSYKPNMDAFMRTLKIVLLGTLIFGIAGFLISVLIGLIV